MAAPESVHATLRGPGRPLDAAARAFFEPRFGQDFSDVRIHQGEAAARSADDIGARAYTVGGNIVLRDNASVGDSASRALLAHELAHVVQQTGGGEGAVRRRVEIRDAGPGEQSGMARVPELITRLTAISTSLTFSLDGGVLKYAAKSPPGPESNFDRQMKGFIDEGTVIPMRMTNRLGAMGTTRDGHETLVSVDSYATGYVDVDDLLASSALGLETSLIHLLKEREVTKDYAKKMGAPELRSQNGPFDAAHEAGLDSELALLRDFFGDAGLTWFRKEPRILNTTRGDKIREIDTVGGPRPEDRGIFAVSWRVDLKAGGQMTPEEYRALLARERAVAPARPVAPPAAAPAP